MPTIYVSGGVFETREQASARAQKYGAVYYGSFAQGVPVDHAHWQYDNEKQFGGSGKGPGGHMTAEGCLMVAQGMAPLVEKTLVEKIGIKPAR
jgi:hypothetical protein